MNRAMEEMISRDLGLEMKKIRTSSWDELGKIPRKKGRLSVLKFPKGLLKEFRDVFDHISRCYEEDAAEQYIEENIQKAENHFNRIKLDTYKYISDYKKREFVRWKKKYGKYDLQNINDGIFWKTILDLEDEGERIFSGARSIESKNIVKSCEMLQESTIKYDEIFKLINKKRELILRAKFKYRRVTLVNALLVF